MSVREPAYLARVPRRTRVPRSKGTLTPAQWRALSSPHRFMLFAALQALGRATVADLAQLTGRSQPSLYHHLRIMATHRLVGQEVERRAGRPVRVFVYDASVNRRVVDAKTGQGIKELGTLAGAMLREVGTRVRRWATVHDRRPIRTGADADAILVTELAWFTPRERARAIRHLHALIRLARSTHGRRRGERFCMTLLQFRDYTAREARQERAGSRK